MSPLSPGDILAGTWRIVRPALGDEPDTECQVEPISGEGPGRLTLWRTLRAPTASELEHFARGLRAAEATGHAAFPPVLDVGYDATREALWLVRPWWNGESLPSMLGGLHAVGLDIPYLQVLAEQLAQALDTAHAAGLVHGRLRASRVLVASGDSGVRSCVLDMGWEQFRRAHAQSWLKPPQVGEDYLAPELGETGPLPASTDIFSFGHIMRDMLATRKDGAWTGHWEAWVERASAPEPARRFASAAEALSALRPILRALPDPAPPRPENYEPEPPDPLALPPR
ncbi:serine/threonine protein kinase [Melittangium boletus DSM 14713]|uniref:Serine/threonine protein kinase n=1 Tax=Melittangium boletus DSM 14713 TaxID=1294270 RepID=A0A250IJU3_9BACT|nr:serine/threonine protein kinase [Melittangium boletus DSM 14713]